MSVAKNLMYDITITKITGNDFTGTATIYTDGQNPMANVPVTGTITTGSSITGTLSGTGAGNGTFSLTYAKSNNQISAISRIVTTLTAWKALIGLNSPGDYEFGIKSTGTTGTLFDVFPTANSYFDGCAMNGTVTALSKTSLYSVAVTITACSDGTVNDKYTGLAATQDATDAVLAMTLASDDGKHSISADFNH